MAHRPADVGQWSRECCNGQQRLSLDCELVLAGPDGQLAVHSLHVWLLCREAEGTECVRSILPRLVNAAHTATNHLHWMVLLGGV